MIDFLFRPQNYHKPIGIQNISVIFYENPQNLSQKYKEFLQKQ